MPINSSIFKTATATRDSITKEQQEYIKSLYKKWSDDVLEEYASAKYGHTASDALNTQYYNVLYKQMEAQSKEISNGIYTSIKDGMAKVSDAVVKDAVDWMSAFGFSKKGMDAAMSYIPQSTVNALVTGSVYGGAGSWNLSAAIWGDNEKTLRDIYAIMGQGIAQQMPIQKIAEKLSQYVSPTKQLQWSGPGGVKIYKKAVDYNAQRLARTLVQHTYQQSFVAATKDNPFITEYVWLSNGPRVCLICADRDGKHFKKDKLPLDHPNGMCVMEPVVVDNLTDKIADWVNSPDGTYPEIDSFAKKFGYDVNKLPKMNLADIKKQYGNSQYKSPNAWFKQLPKDVQDTVSKIHQASGKKWTQWYQDEIMDPKLKKAAQKTVEQVEKDVKKAAKKINDVLDDVADTAEKAVKEAKEVIDYVPTKQEMEAAKKAVSDLTDEKKALDAAKKQLKSELDAFDKNAIKDFDQLKNEWNKNYELPKFSDKLEKKYGWPKTKEFFNDLDELIDDSADDIVKFGNNAAIKAKEKLEKNLEKAKKFDYSDLYIDSVKRTYTGELRRELLIDYLDDGLDKLPESVVSKLDDLFRKHIGATLDESNIAKQLSAELKQTSEKIKIVNVEIKAQKAIAKGATKEFAGKTYDEALSYLKNVSYKFYKDNVVKTSQEFTDAIDDLLAKAKTSDIDKAFSKYSSGQIKSEKFDSLLDLANDYKTGLKKPTNSTVSDFTADQFTEAAKKKAKNFSSKRVADRYLREWLDDNWDELDDYEKYSIWKYTENSNPLNKPLSGYSNATWNRSDFVGLGNADWSTEDNWRSLYTDEFIKKFGKDGTSKIDHAEVIANLTTAIDKFEMDESMWLYRGSDINGLTGLFEGSGFKFDDVKDVLFQYGDEYKQFEGMIVENHAFTSTAISSDAGLDGEVKYKIYAPKGTRGVYAEPQSYYGNTISDEEIYEKGKHYSSVGKEAEVILQRGTEFRVTKITKISGFNKYQTTKYEVELEIVDQPKYFDTGFEQTISSGTTSFKKKQ